MVGRPELHRQFTLLRAVLMLAVIWPAVRRFGLSGAAASGLFAMLVGYTFQMMRLRKITALDLRDYVFVFLPGLGASICVVLTWLVTHSFSLLNPVTQIVFGAAGCFLAYGFILGRIVRLFRAA
jgi:hypothetical protein